MHVRVRLPGKPEAIIVVDSKLTKIEVFRKLVEKKFDVVPELQRLFYGGKVLEDGYTFHDYTIKLNDVIQLMPKLKSENAETSDAESICSSVEEKKAAAYEDVESVLYRVGEYVDARDAETGAWFEGKICRIVRDPKVIPKPVKQTNGDAPKATNGHISPVKQTNGDTSKATNGHKSPVKQTKGDTLKATNGHKSPPAKSDDDSPKKEAGKEKSVKTPKGRKSKSNVESPITPKRTKGITDYFNKTPKSGTKSDAEDHSSKNGHSSKTEDGSSTPSAENPKIKKETNGEFNNDFSEEDDYGILYEVELEESSEHQFCKKDEIRPRARTEIDPKDLKEGETYLVNYNIEEPNERGYWYDFTVWQVKSGRKNTEITGTLYFGAERVPQDGTKVQLVQPAFQIESIVPLKDRTTEYNNMMTTTTEKSFISDGEVSEYEEDVLESDKSVGDFGSDDEDGDPDYCPGVGPLNCSACRDDENKDCKDCGCYLCAGKENPEKIILCDECNNGFHMDCLKPPMSGVPNEDWYCPDCKRSDEVIAPGGNRKQKKKTSIAKSARDWGRGMACVGKTQSCAMPANHFGPIPGVEVGMMWRFRIQLSESGVHRPPVSGIHGRDVEGAYSLVLSGGYEDDLDNGFEFTYTGSGGRDLSGNKRTADQSSDQTLTRENKALARNCALAEVKEKGGDAKDKWRDGRPVRVVRSYKLAKHCPKYAPKEGVRYDGIYKVVKYYPEIGKSGFKVWKYLLRRDDPNPAPWEKSAKQYSIVYPDGYLEAEAEKQASKGVKKAKDTETPQATKKKRVLKETNGNASQDDIEESQNSPPAKKARVTRASLNAKEETAKSPKVKAVTPKSNKKDKKKVKTPTAKQGSKGENPFAIASKTGRKVQKENSPSVKSNAVAELSENESNAIKDDEVNEKLWKECLRVFDESGRKQFIHHITDLFKCIICQDVATNPVTTKCQHNFCKSCLKLAFKTTEGQSCSYCRQTLTSDDLVTNEKLKIALRTLMPGYDLGKK